MMLAPWHEEGWRLLAERRARGSLPHALLFCGPVGLGKRDFADAFARSLLCIAAGAEGQACGQCRACKLFDARSHPDCVRVNLELRDDGKLRTEIIVDQIRALGARLAMTAQFGGHQIALIDPADAMNANASNALLKTLEEPTAATLIILLSDAPARLSATIRSRCQRIDFRLPSTTQALAWLAAQSVDAKTAAIALNASGGNPGQALIWAGSGGLALREEVAADLRAVYAGTTTPLDVANRWSRAEAETRLWFAAALVQGEAQAQARGASGPLALTTRPDFTKLALWFDQANGARVHLRGPLRPELVLLEVLSTWGASAPGRASMLRQA
jgi:DNA polymerase-3 subunit delta'